MRKPRRDRILDAALLLADPGPYQTQAAIAALHAAAATPARPTGADRALYQALLAGHRRRSWS
jgi:predicted RNA polymerase sigma factor